MSAKTNSKTTDQLSVNDRVIRAGTKGPKGTVTKVRIETTRTTLKTIKEESPGVTVSVLWDNGTESHFVPEGLNKVA